MTPDTSLIIQKKKGLYPERINDLLYIKDYAVTEDTMRIAFVIPWFGEDIMGGAELECRYTALHLIQKGVKVKILTTCVKDFYSRWDHNYHNEGDFKVGGLSVKRFPVKKRHNKTFHFLNQKIFVASLCYTYSNFSSSKRLPSPLSPLEEERFMEEMINSPLLYKYIYDNRREYDYFIFIPYLFSTTYFGSAISPERSVLIPCIHDYEINAYLQLYRTMFDGVRKIIFHTFSEERLAMKLYGLNRTEKRVIGEGVTLFDSRGERFRERYRIDYPFILYVGRRSEGKNVPLLLSYFYRYREDNPESDLRLLLIGDGKINIPARHKGHVIDMGILSDEDKYDAYSAALLLCQPSMRESFSIVIMESWLSGRPVLVHGYCDVTREHCIKGNGGLYFVNYPEFEMCVNLFVKYPDISKRMGRNGKLYVTENYNWHKVTDEYIDFLTG